MQKKIAISKTNINGAEVNSVNSREIHSRLEVKTCYSMWIGRAIKKYCFYENVDYVISKCSHEITYIVTLEMARKLCMLVIETESKRRNAILMRATKTYTTTEIAKEIGMESAIKLNRMLTAMKIQFKKNGIFVLYPEYADLGYMNTKKTVLDSGKIAYGQQWTQEGKAFILGVLNG